jgi:uncharacterized protein YlxP (DUF503 family)
MTDLSIKTLTPSTALKNKKNKIRVIFKKLKKKPNISDETKTF